MLVRVAPLLLSIMERGLVVSSNRLPFWMVLLRRCEGEVGCFQLYSLSKIAILIERHAVNGLLHLFCDET